MPERYRYFLKNAMSRLSHTALKFIILMLAVTIPLAHARAADTPAIRAIWIEPAEAKLDSAPDRSALASELRAIHVTDIFIDADARGLDAFAQEARRVGASRLRLHAILDPISGALSSAAIERLEAKVRETAKRPLVDAIHFPALDASPAETAIAPDAEKTMENRSKNRLEILERLAKIARQTRPDIQISAGVPCLGTPGDAINKLNAWPAAIERGIIDTFVLENHRPNQSEEHIFIQWLQYAQALPKTRSIVVSVSGRYNYETDIAMQIRLALASGLDGVLLHSYERPAQDLIPGADILGYLGRTVFSPSYTLPAYIEPRLRQAAAASAASQIANVPLPKIPEFTQTISPGDLPPPIVLTARAAPRPTPTSAPTPTPRPRPATQANAAWALMGRKSPVEKKSPTVTRAETKPRKPRSTPPPIPPERLVSVQTRHGREFKAELLTRGAYYTTLRLVTGGGNVKITMPNSDIVSIDPAGAID